jgi:hypothetical protein
MAGQENDCESNALVDVWVVRDEAYKRYFRYTTSGLWLGWTKYRRNAHYFERSRTAERFAKRFRGKCYVKPIQISRKTYAAQRAWVYATVWQDLDQCLFDRLHNIIVFQGPKNVGGYTDYKSVLTQCILYGLMDDQNRKALFSDSEYERVRVFHAASKVVWSGLVRIEQDMGIPSAIGSSGQPLGPTFVANRISRTF